MGFIVFSTRVGSLGRFFTTSLSYSGMWYGWNFDLHVLLGLFSKPVSCAT